MYICLSDWTAIWMKWPPAPNKKNQLFFKVWVYEYSHTGASRCTGKEHLFQLSYYAVEKNIRTFSMFKQLIFQISQDS